MKSLRGSLWNKWDLHVHTPESLVHHYPGTRDEAWAAFLADVESLPPEIKVLGINDYLFIDGYRRVLAERAAGRLQNIETVFPVVELRLSAFGGANEHLKRVNFHVVFSDELTPDVIQAQFINALAPGYQLSPQYAEMEQRWAAVPDRDGLTSLGQMIIDSVPVERRRQFGPPLLEGFNAFNVDLRHLLSVLERPQFEGKYLKGVGKTEWDAIAWGDNTIADKKQIINSADFVFVASEDPARWQRAHQSLIAGAVNSRLLDCSDAHHLSTSRDKDRLGNCWTWIKADTTFEGLRHALTEFEQRVFIGSEPPLLIDRRNHGSRYVDRISLKKVVGSTLAETWFQVDVPVNAGVVAIIGNKGTGKSALAESIGLVGNTRQQDFFSFLSPNKFRPRSNSRAAHFEAAITWASGVVHSRRLDQPSDSAAPENIQFIPQNFLEKVCNELPGGEERDFDRELKRVIFSHVDTSDRLRLKNLDDLIEFKTRTREATLTELRAELSRKNVEIADLESKLMGEYRRSLKTQAHGVVETLRDLRRSMPNAVAEPEHTDESAAAAAAVAEAQASYEGALAEGDAGGHALTEINTRATKLGQLISRIDGIERNLETVRIEFSEFLQEMSWRFEDVIALRVDRDGLAAASEEMIARQNTLRAEIEAARARAVEKAQERDRLQTQLDAPHQAYQAYCSRRDEWEREREALIGDPDTPGTLRYFQRMRREVGRLPLRVSAARERRSEIVASIHAELSALREEYARLYRPIQSFVAEHPINNDIGLTVAVGLVDTGFETGFFDYINRRLASTFAGAAEGEAVVRDLLAEHDLNALDGAMEFVEAIHQGLREDTRHGPRKIEPTSLLRKGKQLAELYDYIFGLSYLEPRYTLRFGDKDLHQLSPGEKGTLLLIFYLLIDKSTTPLVIDQPEDNLDNQTVFQVLVTCIREARRRRQIFLVTHNPNLAVVCDADQVIVARIEKDQGNRILYDSGALENPEINRRVVDILEGTRPAFDNRGLKYLKT